MGSENLRDSYSDFVLSQLLSPSTAIKLTRAERLVILAAVRSEVLVNESIRDELRNKVRSVVEELVSARRRFPTAE